MIQKRQLKILIYALHTIYVFGENNLINTERNEIMNASMTILASDYAEYAVSSKINNSFLKSFKKVDEFRDKMIEHDQNQLLLDDYPKSNNTTFILDTTIKDIVQTFEHNFNPFGELKTNEILSQNDSLMCNEIGIILYIKINIY